MILLAVENGEGHCNNNFRGMGLEPDQNTPEACYLQALNFPLPMGIFEFDFPLFSIIHSTRYNCLATVIFTYLITLLD